MPILNHPWALTIFTSQEACPKTASKASTCKNVGFYYTPSPLIKSVVDLYLTTGKEIKSIFKAWKEWKIKKWTLCKNAILSSLIKAKKEEKRALDDILLVL